MTDKKRIDRYKARVEASNYVDSERPIVLDPVTLAVRKNWDIIDRQLKTWRDNNKKR